MRVESSTLPLSHCASSLMGVYKETNGHRIDWNENLVFDSLPPESFPLFLSSADFFQNQLLQKIISGIRPECQKVWIQIKPDVLGPNCLQKLSADETRR